MAKYVPLQEIIDGFNSKYRPRNRAFMHTRGDIGLFLQDALLQFTKQIRRGDTPKRELLRSLGSIFSRTVTLADSFHELEIVQELCKKYPSEFCAYCQMKPCECDYSKRKNIKEVELNEFQLQWSIHRWRIHLRKVYGKSNNERNIDVLVSRLIEELLEVSNAEFTSKNSAFITTSDFREEISKEFADVFAWIFAISNILEVNLDGLLKSWAFRKCSDCRCNPCDCGPFVFVRF